MADSDAYAAEGASASRIALSDIEQAIVSVSYLNAGDAVQATWSKAGHPSLDLMTICLITLRNGFTVIGTSACASPENYDEDKGCRFAHEDAIRKIWPLMGFALRDRLMLDDAKA